MDKFLDFHGHFLPNMDDGCKNTAESLEVLRQAAAQGVAAMVATPHFYSSRESVDSFLARRQASYDALLQAMASKPDVVFPEIRLGAEVAYRPNISRLPDLEKLCMANSRYLLLELPFSDWTNEMMREIQNISVARGLIPVLAHLDRYMEHGNRQKIQEFFRMDLLVQVNAEGFLSFSGRRTARKRLRYGNIDLLGSDCHNLTSRKPNLAEGIRALQKLSPQTLHHIKHFSAELYDDFK